MEVVSAIDFLKGRALLLEDAGKIEVIRKKTLFGMERRLL